MIEERLSVALLKRQSQLAFIESQFHSFICHGYTPITQDLISYRAIFFFGGRGKGENASKSAAGGKGGKRIKKKKKNCR